MSHPPETGLHSTIPHRRLEKYYRQESERRSFVVHLFDRTAPHYDLVNRIMSLGSGLRYRRDALRRAGLARGMTMLDVAVGTGLMTQAALDIQGDSRRITGLDVSFGMLHRARSTVAIPLVQGCAEQLPFSDDAVDFLTMGFALRHVSDLESTFLEYQRVLKPGGTLLMLELTRPPPRTMKHAMLRFYIQKAVPLIARLGPGAADAQALMDYFWDTVDNCVPPETILDALGKCGFARPLRKQMLFRMFSEYVALKPA